MPTKFTKKFIFLCKHNQNLLSVLNQIWMYHLYRFPVLVLIGSKFRISVKQTTKNCDHAALYQFILLKKYLNKKVLTTFCASAGIRTFA